eukprot:Gb_07521 [translate_table: standard]
MEEAGRDSVEERPKQKLGFARQLASCNKKTRDRAVELLKAWLASQKHVGEEDLKKIWKGLFYCLWHADKQPVQADVIEKLASLVQTLDLDLSRQYFQVFLLTMRREWSGIDHLRLDKFYLFLRRFLHHVLLVLDGHGWDSQLTKEFMDDLTDRTFLAVDRYPAQGISLHFLDVYLNELLEFLPLRLETIGLLLEPLYSVLAKASDKLLLKRVKNSVFDCLLENGRKLIKCRQEEGRDAGIDNDDKVEKFGFIALAMGITSRLLDLATSDSTLQANRKVLYALHEDFSKLDKHFAASGVDIFSNRAKSPKHSVDNSMEVEGFAGQESVRADVESQKVDSKMEPIEESNPKTGKKIKGKKGKSGKAKKVVDGSSVKKTKSKGSSEIQKKKSHLGGQNTADDEVTVDAVADNDDSVNEKQSLGILDRNLGDSMELGDLVVSNLQKQFEKVAAELDDDLDQYSSPVISLVSPMSPLNAGSKKRKRVKDVENKVARSPGSLSGQENGESAAGSFHSGKSGDKSAKKVRFSMKSNLVWKPHSPLPPQNLRVPPSATPRGSALKKGVPPGPIRIMKESPSPKKMRQRSILLRKSPKNLKSISPGNKLLRKRRSNPW